MPLRWQGVSKIVDCSDREASLSSAEEDSPSFIPGWDSIDPEDPSRSDADDENARLGCRGDDSSRFVLFS
jgi:hypothetical protein